MLSSICPARLLTYDGDGAVSPPPHMFLRAGSAVEGLRVPLTTTPELREWRLTGGGASAIAWAVAARRASPAACRARKRSSPAALRRSATGRLILEVRRVDRRLSSFLLNRPYSRPLATKYL